MAFENRQQAKTYEPQPGDTLRSIAERETAAGNPITWQELARYNWGTADADEVETLMRDELGARARDVDKRFVVSADDEPRGELKIPQGFRHEGLAVNQEHVIRVRRRTTPGQMLGCCSVAGVNFGFDSSFILPTIVDQLQVLEKKAKAFPEAKVLVFGHTDAVGDEDYNKKLGERRAASVYAFITNDADAWEGLYQEEDWGLEPVQTILADLGHDPGPPDGDWGPKTRAGMRSFLGLGEDAPVANDAAFRKQLFAAYMESKHDVDLGPERFMDPAVMGCGEFNPVEDTGGKSEANRRVTFFLFHPDRLPNLPCALADCGPCRRQMVTRENRHTDTFRCSFYDSLDQGCGRTPVIPPPALDWISFSLVSREDGLPVPGARYTLELPDGRVVEGRLDDKGAARVETPPGTCVLRFLEYHAAEWDADEDAALDLQEEEGALDDEEEPEAVLDPVGGDSPFGDDDPDDEDA